MKVTVEADVLQEALRVVSKLAPPVSGTVTVHVDGKKMFIHSTSDLSRATVNLPADVSGTADFAVGFETLRDATKGRSTLNMVFEKTVLKITSGKYAAELATTDALRIDVDESEKKEKPIKLDVEQLAWLKNAIAAVALKPTTALSAFMPVTIRLSEKGAFVSCYDNSHMAFLSSKEINGSMSVTLPLDTMQLIVDTFGKASCKLELGTSNLHVSSQLVKVALALPQEEDNSAVGPDVVMAKARSASKEAGIDITASKQSVSEFIDNAKSVATKERGEISIKAEKGAMKFEVVTSAGSARTLVKANVAKAVSAKVDYDFFAEAVSKCGEELDMRIVGDAFIMFRTAKACVLLSLNQD